MWTPKKYADRKIVKPMTDIGNLAFAAFGLAVFACLIALAGKKH